MKSRDRPMSCVALDDFMAHLIRVRIIIWNILIVAALIGLRRLASGIVAVYFAPTFRPALVGELLAFAGGHCGGL